MLSPEKIQVLLEVAQRAPASLAEQIICREVAGELAQLVAAQQRTAARRAAKASARAGAAP